MADYAAKILKDFPLGASDIEFVFGSVADALIAFVGKFENSPMTDSEIQAASAVAASLMTGIGNLLSAIGNSKDFNGNPRDIQQDLEAFGAGLPAFGQGLKEFTDYLKDFNIQKVLDSYEAIEQIFGFVLSIPTTGGVLTNILAGKYDIEKFSKNLPIFAEGLVKYSWAIVFLNKSAVNRTSSAVSLINELAAGIPSNFKPETTNSTLFGFVTSYTPSNLVSYGNSLAAFATGMVKYSKAISHMKALAVILTASAVNIINQLAANVPETTSTIFGFVVDDKLARFNSNLPGFGKALAEFSNNIAGFNFSNSDKVTGAVKKIVDLMTEIRAFNDNINSTSGLNDEYAYTTNPLVRIIKQFIANGTGVTDEEIKKLHDSFYNVGKEAYSYVYDGFSDGMNGAPQDGQKKIKAAYARPAFIDSIKDLLSGEKVKKVSVDSANDLMEGFITNLNIAFKNYVDLLSPTEDKIKGEFSAFFDYIRSTFNAMAIILELILNRNLNNMVQALRNSKSSFTNTVRDITTSIRRIWVDHVNGYYNLGQSMMKGLRNGIRDNQRLAVTQSAIASSQAFLAAKKAVRSNSPSKDFEELGYNDMLGLRNGIEKYASLPENASSEASKSIYDSMTDSLSAAYAYINSILANGTDFTPVITPVLDLSQVQNGINSMGTMFGNASLGVGSLSYANTMMPASMNLDSMDITTELIGIRRDLKNLGESMSNMKMVMDSGALVGSITPAVDRQLGTIYGQKDRWA